jgi:hypothetical protein
MINHDPDREREQTRGDERAKGDAYRSIRERLAEVRALERYRDKCTLKRTGITHPARLYGRNPEEIDPAFDGAMGRLWDLGTLPLGRADTELRRVYHLLAQGRAPLCLGRRDSTGDNARRRVVPPPAVVRAPTLSS